jgi:hypothetical protein
MEMNASQLQTLLTRTIPARLNVLITGAPGVGKTDIVKSAAETAGVELLVSHPVTDDPTDYKGLPFPSRDGKSASFLPFGQFEYALNSTAPLVWLWDDFGQAANAVQAAAMQLFHGGQLNGHRLPPHVSFIICTNRRSDRAGVGGVLEPVKSRFQTIVDLVPDIESWCNWAIGAGIPITLIAFLRFRPDLLCDFKPTADMSNSPMPRTWHNLAKLDALQLPAQIELATMAGAVGDGPAAEYLAFRKMYSSLQSVDAMLLDPAACKLPSKPDELYAVCTALASKATETNLSRIGTIANRLMDAGRGEFSALMLKDAIRRAPKLAATDAYVRIAVSPVGQLLSGIEV